jgi:hypothetical protein
MVAVPSPENDAAVTAHPPTSQAKYIDFLENKLNTDLGWFYWKKYVAAAFWAQVSTPINLVITTMTALTTAQASAPDLIPPELYRPLTYFTLLLTVLNTFFRPHEKLQQNIASLKEWTGLGIAFEKVYYSDKNNNYDVERISTSGSLEQSAGAYIKLQDDIHALRQKEGPEMVNFLTDAIHLLCHYTCLRRHRKWLERDASASASALPVASTTS